MSDAVVISQSLQEIATEIDERLTKLVGHKPRCFNKPPGKGYLEVQDGWTEDGRRVMITIPNTMSKDCKQWEPNGEAFRHKWDCEGCCWKPK